MTFPEWFAGRHPQIPVSSVGAVLKLAEGGATVPFIARYRKEETGNLDEVAIRQVLEAGHRTNDLAARHTATKAVGAREMGGLVEQAFVGMLDRRFSYHAV